MEVLIYGAGGHSREIAELLVRSGHSIIAFVDDALRGTTHVPTGLPVVSREQAPTDVVGFVVAIGDPLSRERLFDELSKSLVPVTVRSQSVSISQWADIGPGLQAAQNAVVNAGAYVGPDVILNVGCVVSHDVSVGAHTHIAPGVLLGGASNVGARCLVGAGSIVLPGVQVGDDCVVGAGSVVTKDVASGCTVVGSPARTMISGECSHNKQSSISEM
jgi:sugar O-acyltransferase (sialic acid O-acetyltransferase NeuD family)